MMKACLFSVRIAPVLVALAALLGASSSSQAIASEPGRLQVICYGEQDIDRCLQGGLSILREKTSCEILPAETSAICKFEMPHVINDWGPGPKIKGETICSVPSQNCTSSTLVDPDSRRYECPTGYSLKQRVKSNEEARGNVWVSILHCEK